MMDSFEYDEAEKIVKKYGQEHLLKFYDELTKENKKELLREISQIDFEQVRNLYLTLIKDVQKKEDKIELIEYVDKAKLSENKISELEKRGTDLIKQNKLAAVTMAGGQGTRLGVNGPKGAYELFPGKSLFSILAGNLKAACKKYETTIEWYIMTSQENNDETINFFEENNYFRIQKRCNSLF